MAHCYPITFSHLCKLRKAVDAAERILSAGFPGDEGIQLPRSACQVSRLDWRRHHRKVKPTRKGRQTRVNPPRAKSRGAYNQWAGSRDDNLLGLRSWEIFFLDIPFYRTN